MSSTELSTAICKMYDAKQLKKLAEMEKFIKFFNYSQPKLTAEQRHRMKVESKWYDRRVARVKRVMEAYRISASSLCDCDS